MMKVAWSTHSLSNGFIDRWSRWHIAYNVEGPALCGMPVPRYEKLITGGKDFRIKGGHCVRCKICNKARYPKPIQM